MSKLSGYEPTVHSQSSMQKGYVFVKKGNVYITKNCRKLTSEAGKTVYVVEDSQKKQLGIRVPQHIYQQVRKANMETQDARAEAVMKKDQALETKVRSELLRLYPKIPAQVVESVLKHTLKKRSGRVGRSKDMDINEMVNLAVRAHIRHTQTEYDSMLKKGISRERARDCIQADVDKKVEEWGGKTRGGRGKSLATSRSKLETNKQHTTRKKATRTKKNSLAKTTKSAPRSVANFTKPMRLLRRSSLRIKEAQERDYSEELDLMELD